MLGVDGLPNMEVAKMISNKPCSKFYAKSLTLLTSILKLIAEGYTQSQIAEYLQIERPHVSYYVKKAIRMGYVKEGIRDACKILELTQPGKNFLDWCEKGLPICRAENIRFKANVLKMPTIPLDWHKVQMHNWTQYTSEVDSIAVKLNLGDTPTIEFIPSPVEGDNPYILFAKLQYDCDNAAKILEQRLHMQLGRLELSSRGEWLTYDPIARAWSKHNGQITIEGLAKVNASKPRCIGEFEFHDPRSLADFLAMPKRIGKIEQLLEKLVDTFIPKEPNLDKPKGDFIQ